VICNGPTAQDQARGYARQKRKHHLSTGRYRLTTVQDLVTTLSLEVAAGAAGLSRQVTGGYASDLLSCVMARAQAGNVWVTLQAHVNVMAVAALLDLACVIITEGARPDAAALARAEERGIPVLLTPRGTFTIVAALAALGVRESKC